jgi:hypothetical protein
MVERHHHSRPVDYVPTGRDATVYWGVYDLKFRNSLKHPILLLTSVANGKVSFKIVGSREDDADVEITREGLTRIPHGKKEIDDPELEEGKKEVEEEGRDGWRVTVYRKATREGEVIRDEKLHTDVYAAETRVVRIGTKPVEDEEPEESEEPISGDPEAQPADDAPADEAREETSDDDGRTSVPVPPVGDE